MAPTIGRYTGSRLKVGGINLTHDMYSIHCYYPYCIAIIVGIICLNHYYLYLPLMHFDDPPESGWPTLVPSAGKYLLTSHTHIRG